MQRHPTAPCSAANCLDKGGTRYAAIVFYAGSRVNAQTRNAPPTDLDDKTTIANYLEGINAGNHPNTAGNSSYINEANVTAGFNGLLYCIQDDLNVVKCP